MDFTEKFGKPLTMAGFCLAGGLGVALCKKRYSAGQQRRFFQEKVVLITGGSRGLGLELARAFAATGARLAICARDANTLGRAGRELRARGGDVLDVPCDVTDPVQCEAFIKESIDQYGRIDVLVNNAGIIQAGPIDCMTVEDFRQALATHFWGPLQLIRHSLPYLRRGAGRIVNIASIGGEIAIPHMVPYCASKFALVGLSEGLAVELRRQGIRVTTVCPGLMRTGSPRNADFKGQHQAEYAWFSISDSLPIVSIGSQAAARRIVAATYRGDPYLRISATAKTAVPLRALFPGLTNRALSFVSQLLPRSPGSSGQIAKKGYQSSSAWSPSLLTRFSEQAAARNNELEK